MDVLFLIGCAIVALATLAVLTWTAHPNDLWAHLRGAARLGVFAGALCLAAGAKDGWRPEWETVLFVWTVGIAYAVQAYSEARRQRQQPVTGDSAASGDSR